MVLNSSEKVYLYHQKITIKMTFLKLRKIQYNVISQVSYPFTSLIPAKSDVYFTKYLKYKNFVFCALKRYSFVIISGLKNNIYIFSID